MRPSASEAQEAVVLTRRALVVKFGSIGDVIMAVPAAAALHATGYSIDWVASKLVAPLLRLYPWIHVIAVDEPRLLRGSTLEKLRESWALSSDLRRQMQGRPYELIATLYYDRRYSLLTSLVPARRRVGLSRTDRRFALLPGRHHTDEYTRILCDRPDGETPFQVAPVPLPSLPPSPRAPRAEPAVKARVVLVPAGARNVMRDDALRRWPIERYVELAEMLLKAGCEVILSGGPEDQWASAHFAALARQSEEDRFANLIGALSLVQTAALLNSAAVTVTHDTGPLHLAGVTSTAVVSIFGPTDPHGRLPHRTNAVAIWGGEGFGCRPCYDGREYAGCLHNGCMVQVTATMVLASVFELIEAQREGKALPPRVLTPQTASRVFVGVAR